MNSIILRLLCISNVHIYIRLETHNQYLWNWAFIFVHLGNICERTWIFSDAVWVCALIRYR